MWKGFREFFTYTHRQRNGLLALAILALLLNVVLYFDDLWPRAEPADFSAFEEKLAEWEKQQERDSSTAVSPVALFAFDPNRLSSEGFQELGLSERQARSIVNYRNKGGVFRQPADLARIYTLDSSDFARLRPYIHIEERSAEFKTAAKPPLKPRYFDPNRASANELSQLGLTEGEGRGIIAYREKFKPFQQASDLLAVYNLDSARAMVLLPYVRLDTLLAVEASTGKPHLKVALNSADSNQLKSLPGIGSVFAGRILQYRERLGGFYAPEQLLEVYGMDPARFEALLPYLEVNSAQLRRLQLNTMEFSELLAHPYLEYEVVQNIVNFRERHRPFQSVEELKQIELIDGHLFSKIAPYLSVDD